jgi:hypothetical protein
MSKEALTLAAAVLAFIASLVATAVVAYNGRFRRFARERWWERKADAYSRIIESLADLVYYHETHLSAAEQGRDLSEVTRTEIEGYWRRGHAEAKRAAAVGAFLISPGAEAALRDLGKALGKEIHPNDWYGMMEDSYVGTKAVLDAVVAAAKKDLGQRN